MDDIRCEYCAQSLGTPETLCCSVEDDVDGWTPYSIGLQRAWAQGINHAGEAPPHATEGEGDWWGFCCGRWLPHHADIERHLRDMHNVLTAR